jgi:hypothetical protein
MVHIPSRVGPYFDVTPSGFVGECKLRAPYFRNALVGGQKRGRLCLTFLPGLVFQVKPVRLDSVGRYAGRGPVPRALFNGRHPPRRAPALRVGYLPLNNALGTGPLPLQIHGLASQWMSPNVAFLYTLFPVQAL